MPQQGASATMEVAALLDGSVLEAIVPKALDFDPTALAVHPPRKQGKEGALSASTPQRTSLYLDENAPVYIILQSPYADETTFRTLLARIDLTLETFAVGNSRHHQDESGPQAVKDLVDTRTFSGALEPVISVTRPEEDSQHGKGGIIASWKLAVHIVAPSVFFAATLLLHSDETKAEPREESEYMESGVPETINILEPFKIDPAFRKNPPVLSAARLAKVLPTGTAGKSDTKLLRNNFRPLLRLIPALNTRARFSRIGASPSQAKVLASLDVDITPWVEGTIQIQSIDFTLSEGRAENLDISNDGRFPITCKQRDSLSFVYNLLPNHFRGTATTQSPVHTLFLALYATCNPEGSHSYPIKINWRTPVDLAALHHKPTVFLPAADSRVSFSSSRASTSSEPASKRPSSASSSSHLVTITVSGPPTIAVHATLRWSLLITNRSSTRTLRLAIIPITSAAALPAEITSHTKQQTQTIVSAASTGLLNPAAKHKHRPTLSTSLFRPAASGSPFATANGPPTATLSSSIPAHSTTGAAAPPTDGDAGLIPLTADIRIGPLAPGACATAEMRFLVLRAGVLPVEALRIVDLDGEVQRLDEEKAWEQGGEVEGQGRRRQRRQWVDVGPELLPDVVAVEEQ